MTKEGEENPLRASLQAEGLFSSHRASGDVLSRTGCRSKTGPISTHPDHRVRSWGTSSGSVFFLAEKLVEESVEGKQREGWPWPSPLSG